MNAILLLLAVVSGVSADIILGQSKIVRVPSEDSAIIQSHRLGGNFAYSTHEAHAYAVETPIIKQRVVPQGVTYHQGEPIVKTHTSYVHQKVPQFAVVRTQHTVPTVQYSAVSAPVQQFVTTHQVAAAPIKQVVATSQHVAAAPVQIVQYAASSPIQYSALNHVQYSASSPIQYSALNHVQYSALSPIQYSGLNHVQYSGIPAQFAVSPVQYITGRVAK